VHPQLGQLLDEPGAERDGRVEHGGLVRPGRLGREDVGGQARARGNSDAISRLDAPPNTGVNAATMATSPKLRPTGIVIVANSSAAAHSTA